VGLSFVRSSSDIRSLKHIISKKGKSSRVIAKIEKPEAVLDISAIIEETDGLMVARGDLGVEMPMEQVPLIQKMLVASCIAASKPVIIATQMMESMIINFRPTRAEVNDVANAVLDGADALMLSAETSVGKYPVEVIEAMHKIISSSETEQSIYYRGHQPNKLAASFVADMVSYNACLMAKDAGAVCITAMTHSGYTALKLASQRPKAHISVFTDNRQLLKILSLVWGVQGFYYDKYESTDTTISDIKSFLLKKHLVKKGDLVIHVASTPLHVKGTTNTIKLNIID
jgi:pyruvate kinase